MIKIVAIGVGLGLALTGLAHSQGLSKTDAAASVAAIGSKLIDAKGVTIGTIFDFDHIKIPIGAQSVLVKATRGHIYSYHNFSDSWQYGAELDYTQTDCKGASYISTYDLLPAGDIVLDDNNDRSSGKIYYTTTSNLLKIKSWKIIGQPTGQEAKCYNDSFEMYGGPAKTLHYSFKAPFIVK